MFRFIIRFLVPLVDRLNSLESTVTFDYSCVLTLITKVSKMTNDDLNLAVVKSEHIHQLFTVKGFTY